MRPHPGERGFTLIEVVIAAGVAVALGAALLYLTRVMLWGSKVMAAQQAAYIQLTHLLETWDAESTSSLAIFVPVSDVLGGSNADGHELDFYSRDASRLGHFWAYRWDPSSSTLQRYTYATPGSVPTATDPPLSGILAFQAVRKPASNLAPAFLAGYVAHDVVVNFGYPGVDGGNAIVDVTVADSRDRFELELLPGTMTSGFEVVVATFDPSASPSPTATPSQEYIGIVTVICQINDGSCDGNPSTECQLLGGNQIVFAGSHAGSTGETYEMTYGCYDVSSS